MDITSSQRQGRVPVTVLQLSGALDSSCYEELIRQAKTIYDKGSRDLLLDLSRLTFISSAGITALHKTALLFRGVKLPEEQEGWDALRSIDRDRDGGVQKHVKLLNPQREVERVLDVVGFKAFFEIHTDLEQAVASF